MCKKTMLYLAFVASMAITLRAGANEAIVLDPTTGDYLITYWATDNNGKEILRQTTFVPKTKVKPAVRSKFSWDHNNTITYRYEVSNGFGAKQDIDYFVIDPVSIVSTSQNLPRALPGQDQGIVELMGKIIRATKEIGTPGAWKPTLNTSRQPGYRLGWGSNNGIRPGGRERGFGFESSDLPGLVNAEVAGNGPAGQGLGENGPDSDDDSDFARQYFYLMSHDYVDVPVAVPAIKPSTPVNLKDIASQLQAHVRTWPALHVMDQATASKIDALLQQTIVALTASDARAASASLKAVRQLLRQSHPGYEADDDRNDDNNRDQASNTGRPVSKLAAKVLGFDVQFLLRQMNNGRDAED